MADAFQKLARQFDREVVEPVRQEIIGRRMVSQKPGVRSNGIWNIDVMSITDMSEAYIDYDLPEGDTERDMIQPSVNNIKAPVLHKSYKIPRQDFEAYRQKGVQVDSEVARSAASVVGQKEDKLIIDGWEHPSGTYEIEGLYQSATNSISTSEGFDTAGNAISAVAGMKAEVAEDGIRGTNYNLLLHPDQYNELDRSILSSGEREYDVVNRMLNPYPNQSRGMVMMGYSDYISSGTAMMTPVDPSRKYIELLELQPLRNILGEDSKMPNHSPVYGTSLEVVYPHVKHSDAICVHTGV